MNKISMLIFFACAFGLFSNKNSCEAEVVGEVSRVDTVTENGAVSVTDTTTLPAHLPPCCKRMPTKAQIEAARQVNATNSTNTTLAIPPPPPIRIQPWQLARTPTMLREMAPRCPEGELYFLGACRIISKRNQ